MKSRFFLSIIFLISFLVSNAQLIWEHTNGHEGASLGQLVNNDKYAFFDDQYFLYRTNDGENWEQISEGNFFPKAVCNDKIIGVQENGGLIKYSGDNGETWSGINKPPGISKVRVLAYCDHGIYTRHFNEFLIFRSKDLGQTWEEISTPFQIVYDIYTFDNRIYISTIDGIWRTDENGENWEELTFSNNDREFVRGIFVVDENIFVGVENKLYYSNDDGQSWQFHSTPFPTYHSVFGELDGVIYSNGGSKELARSFDNGATWEELSAPTFYNENPVFYSAKVNGKLLFANADKGIVTWDDSLNDLKEVNTGLYSGITRELTFDGNEKLWAATNLGVFSYDVNDKEWYRSPLPIPEVYYSNIAADSDGVILTNTPHRSLYISKDTGVTWQVIDDNKVNSFGIEGIKIVGNSIFLVDQYKYGLISHNLGQTWNYSESFTDNIVAHNNRYIMLGSNNTIYASDDEGISWDSIANMPEYSMTLHKAEDRLFIVGMVSLFHGWYYRIYSSTDGINWADVSAGLSYADINLNFIQQRKQFSFSKKDDSYFAYIKNFGFYISNEDLTSWIPLEQMRWKQVEEVNGEIFIGGIRGGVIKAELLSSFQGNELSGTTFLDSNNDGNFNTNENTIAGTPVTVTQSNFSYPFYSTISDETGFYSLGVDSTSADTIRPIVHSDYVEEINPLYYLSNDRSTNHDFGIYLQPDIVDLSCRGNQGGKPRPGFDFSVHATYSNKGTVSQSGKVVLELDEKVNYLSAQPEPDFINGKILEWNFTDLQIFERDRIKVELNLPQDVSLGDSIKNIVKIEPNEPDFAPIDNHYVLCDTVVGSYDPNNKLVEPVDGLTPEEIEAGKKIYYTVNFQNTGTFYAEKVRITDQLDTALVWSSLELITASHDITSFRLNKGGLLEVVFDQIFLQDSTTNEPESHGFVTFAIQRNKNFNPDRSIDNFAAIYFDFNEPIYTNMVSFTIPDEATTSVKNKEQSTKEVKNLLIYPNPTGSGFTVSTHDEIRGSAMLEIFSISGSKVYQQKILNTENPISISSGILASGTYLIYLSNKKGRMVGKIYVE